MKDQVQQSRALEGLPPKFVTAMRTLFDVLDDNKTGSVSLADIEHWWRKDRDEHGGGGSVPNGVIESLRKVANTDSLLTFERFCAGLKICLLRNNADTRSNSEMTVRGKYFSNLKCNLVYCRIPHLKQRTVVTTRESHS